jgi:hypothetical protein
LGSSLLLERQARATTKARTRAKANTGILRFAQNDDQTNNDKSKDNGKSNSSGKDKSKSNSSGKDKSNGRAIGTVELGLSSGVCYGDVSIYEGC